MEKRDNDGTSACIGSDGGGCDGELKGLGWSVGWSGDWSGGQALEGAMVKGRRGGMVKLTCEPGQVSESVLKNRAVSVPAHATHETAAALGN